MCVNLCGLENALKAETSNLFVNLACSSNWFSGLVKCHKETLSANIYQETVHATQTELSENDAINREEPVSL